MCKNVNQTNRIILLTDDLSTPFGIGSISEHLPKSDLESKKILLIAPPLYHHKEALIRACCDLGFNPENCFIFKNAASLERQYDFIYVVNVNAFYNLKYMRQHGLVEYIRECYFSGNVVYIGAGGGAMVTGIDIELALDFEKNRVKITDFNSLGLFEGAYIQAYSIQSLSQLKRCTDESLLKRYEAIYFLMGSDVLIL